jgi:hypothetical protein
VLGLLLCAVIGAFLGFVVWQSKLPESDTRQLLAAHWVLALGAFTAMIGWVTTTLVTIRNSVKQHTITTLLQSRLSVAYVERLKRVNETYSPIGRDLVLVSAADYDNPDAKESLDALRYLLNYFEFTAIAIRHGDLDERLMHASLGGIVRSLYKVGGVLIERARSKDDRNFEHLTWLNDRWQKAGKGRDWETFCLSVGGIVLGIVAGLASYTALMELASSSARPVILVPGTGGSAAPAGPAASAASPAPPSPAAPPTGSALPTVPPIAPASGATQPASSPATAASR